MKFGFRIPSITKRIASRTSPARFVRQNLGLKAPQGIGWVTNPKRFMYNKVYNKMSRGCLVSFVFIMAVSLTAVVSWLMT